jgi:hypothetical protein
MVVSHRYGPTRDASLDRKHCALAGTARIPAGYRADIRRNRRASALESFDEPCQSCVRQLVCQLRQAESSRLPNGGTDLVQATPAAGRGPLKLLDERSQDVQVPNASEFPGQPPRSPPKLPGRLVVQFQQRQHFTKTPRCHARAVHGFDPSLFDAR